MNKTYDIYLFYLIDFTVDQKIIENSVEYKSRRLYAYTLRKKYAKLWKFQRNMKKFYMEKITITRGELNYLYDLFPNGEMYLKRGKSMSESFEISEYKIVITKYEDTMIGMTTSVNLFRNLQTIDRPNNPNIFHPSLLVLLIKIGYLEFFFPQFSDEILKKYFPDSITDDDELPFDDSFADFHMDQLKCFVHLFKDIIDIK